MAQGGTGISEMFAYCGVDCTQCPAYEAKGKANLEKMRSA
jgi:hypothetical protein